MELVVRPRRKPLRLWVLSHVFDRYIDWNWEWGRYIDETVAREEVVRLLEVMQPRQMPWQLVLERTVKHGELAEYWHSASWRFVVLHYASVRVVVTVEPDADHAVHRAPEITKFFRELKSYAVTA